MKCGHTANARTGYRDQEQMEEIEKKKARFEGSTAKPSQKERKGEKENERKKITELS